MVDRSASVAAGGQEQPGKSPERPLHVREVSERIAGWIGRLGLVWVEGQLTEVRRRPGSGLTFAVLRDAQANTSLKLAIPDEVERRLVTPLEDGQRVLVQLKAEFWTNRGDLQMRVYAIRPVGIGELLAQIEKLKGILRAEGLFETKRELPFLPRRVGLICGRESAAKQDVVENARRRWPVVQFEIREVAVQGGTAALQVKQALIELDAITEVDVIVITRGGGSFEDLLPFSDEALVRAVAAARTPVVSAIGHEQDQPLLDFVADLRASTPTDAAKRIVPDMAAETAGISDARSRMRRAVLNKVEAGYREVEALSHRPVIADPIGMVKVRERDLAEIAGRSLRAMQSALDRSDREVLHLSAQVAALSPLATLARGYAVVQTSDSSGRRAVVRSAAQVSPGDDLLIRVAEGAFLATATGGDPADQPENQTKTNTARTSKEEAP